MNHTYGGLTLYLESQVLIFDAEGAVPIFHRSGTARREGCSWWINRTRCGLVWLSQKDDEPMTTAGTWIPARHAVRFARPCRRCWPELLTRPTLFARPPSTRDTSQQLAA